MWVCICKCACVYVCMCVCIWQNYRANFVKSHDEKIYHQSNNEFVKKIIAWVTEKQRLTNEPEQELKQQQQQFTHTNKLSLPHHNSIDMYESSIHWIDTYMFQTNSSQWMQTHTILRKVFQTEMIAEKRLVRLNWK